MNAIEKYIDALQTENATWIFITIIILVICLIELIYLTKFSDELNQLTAANENLQKENNQLKQDLVRERKKNDHINKIEFERDSLKKKLQFVLKNPPKFPIGTKVLDSQINKIDIVIPGIVSYSVFAIRKLFGLKTDKPTPQYLYYIEIEGCNRPRNEYEIELLKPVKPKKSTKNGKNSNQKTGKKA